MQVVARELTGLERPKLVAHFLALDAEDRRLRFGLPHSDASVADNVERIDFGRDALFGVFDDELGVAGAAHLARAEDHAELGVSVLPAHRGRGIGGALIAERAGLFDYALKSQLVTARRLLASALAAPKAPGSGRSS